MPLNIKQIEHVASLARISLTPKDKQKFTQQLGDILDYFDKLKKLDTKNIPVSSQTIELININRSDQVKDCDPATQKKILDNAPHKSGDYFKTGKIL